MVFRANGSALGVLVSLGAWLMACGGGGAAPAPRPCDPFAVMTKSITLATVMGVGRDATGTIYVVDGHGENPERLFASSGTTLVRQKVGGTGTASDGSGTLLVMTSGTPDAPLTVEVQVSGGHATAMGLYRGTLATKTFAIGSMGETLQLMSAGDIAGFSLQNLPGTVSATHVATTADGRWLVVTQPDVDATVTDVRVFFGTPDALRERRVIPTAQPRSYAQIEFDLDGQTATARFASSLAPSITSALNVGGQETPLTDASAGDAPANASYLCSS
jgi:hypothetical protein